MEEKILANYKLGIIISWSGEVLTFIFSNKVIENKLRYKEKQIFY